MDLEREETQPDPEQPLPPDSPSSSDGTVVDRGNRNAGNGGAEKRQKDPLEWPDNLVGWDGPDDPNNPLVRRETFRPIP